MLPLLIWDHQPQCAKPNSNATLQSHELSSPRCGQRRCKHLNWQPAEKNHLPKNGVSKLYDKNVCKWLSPLRELDKIRQKVLVVAKIIHGVSWSCSNMTRCTKLIRIWSYLYLQSHPPFYFAGRQRQRKRSSGKKGIIFWLVTIFGTSSKGWLKWSHVSVSNFSLFH